jgi:hypothetical protein
VQLLGFLQWLRRRYPPGHMPHGVSDNYSPHLKENVNMRRQLDGPRN